MSRWELAAGTAIGAAGPAQPLPVQPLASVTEALEAAVLPALSRPPCVVSFSGGFDSSLVLAVATAAARKHGLPEPVPVTLRFPSAPPAEESSWQELSIRHLGLSDWQRLELGEELDFLGEIATEGLRRHGLLWPANAHVHVPIFARASGGSVLTGLDGDGLFGGWRWQRARAAIEHTVRPQARDRLRVLLATAPEPLRAAVLAARRPFHAPWLRPHAALRLRVRLAREAAGEPNRWDDRVGWYARRRYLALGVHSLALLAADHDVQLMHPLAGRGFLAAVAARGGSRGFVSRRQAMGALFSDLLPAALLERRTKAEFGRALWGPGAREFAASWDGRGLDPSLVDADRLRRTWSQPNPPLAAATLLQAAWLVGSGNETR